MFDPTKLDELADIVTEADFYLRPCGICFAAMQKMRLDGKPIDAVTLMEKLQKLKRWDEVGEQFLIECGEKVPHAAHAVHYAETIRDKAIRRQIIGAASDGILAARSDVLEVEQIIGELDGKLHAQLERRVGQVETSLSALLLRALESIGGEKAFGITSGFEDVDKLTNGWQPGSLTVLAARPSVGKTALAIKWLMNAVREGIPGLFFSLEQTSMEVSERILSMESHVPVTTMRQKGLGEDVRDRLCMNAGIVGEWPLFVDDTPGRTITSIGAMTRLFVRRQKIKLVVVDYLQLIEPLDRRQPREQQVAEASRGLKRIAKELKIAVVCLAQLNRQVEMRTDKAPVLSDLRESGSIEQDADVVCMIERPGSYDEMAEKTEACLYVRKNRNGQTGKVSLFWDGPTMEFKPSAFRVMPEQAEQEQRDEDREDWRDR